MTRHVRTSGKATKQGPRKSASSGAHKRSTDATGLRKQLAEAIQQQAASAEVLKIVGSSPGDMKPVFEAILVNALRICDAKFGHILLYKGERFDAVHLHDVPPSYRSFWEKHGPLIPGPNTALGRLAQTRQVEHIPDLKADPAYAERQPLRVVTVEQAGARSFLAVPMLKENKLIGAIVIYRQEVRPFAEKQIDLVKTFADQALIAIENARLFEEVQAKTRDLEESLLQQTATSDVLKVISRSAFDLDTVMNTLAGSARALCGSKTSNLFLRDGDRLVCRGAAAVKPEDEEYMRANPVELNEESHMGRAVLSGTIANVGDFVNNPHTKLRKFQQAMGFKSFLAVPLMREGRGIGVFTLSRDELGPFSHRQVELVQSFADQAVIAIENVRLFEEVQAKTRDLEESLQQQTATADVLKVISRSAFDIHAVLRTLVESAARLCQAETVQIFLLDGELYRSVAHNGFSPEYQRYAEKNPIAPGRGTLVARTALEMATVHIPDVLLDPEYTWHEGQKLGGFRAMLGVPLLTEGSCIGVMAMTRKTARPFTDRQIELVRVFADQAVIAIGNVRLFDEVKARTEDLRESLQQQTATADVLKVISRSTVDLDVVLDTLVDTVARLCRGDQALMYRRQNDRYHLVASHGLSDEAIEFIHAHPLAPDRGTAAGRVVMERHAVHIPDVLQDSEYRHGGAKLARARSLLGIPLLREDTLIGILVVQRTSVDPFLAKEMELATTFADQAVIAIENARLFEELRERQAELRVTFDNMGDGVVMFDDEARLAAWNRNFQEMLDLPEPFLAGRPSYADYFRFLAERGEYSSDLEERLSRTVEDTRREMRLERTRPDGRVIEVRRNPVPDGGFVLIYADITERKRAEETIRLARDAAEKALRELQTAQDRLVQTQKLASLGQLTAGIAHEIKNPLNFVNNFSALSVELADELNEVLKQITLADKVQREVDELTTLLKDNLGKVVQHGKRADSIVKNMLLHSREGSGEHRLADINSVMDESLNLAYHGARAEKSGFNVVLERDFDPATGAADIYPQEITRVFLNLISNGFYAAARRAAESGDGFEPKVRAITRNLGDRIEIRIRDNGTGIPLDIREKIFNPFFTTKPAGEGTGLGLSMSYDIIVKQHGGTIQVDSEPGVFTEFVVTLPRAMFAQEPERSRN